MIRTADELVNFSRGEESLLEEQIKSIADAGTDVIVAGAKFGDMALHYINKYNMMAVRLNSKFDVRRLCKAVNATALPRLVCISFLYVYILHCLNILVCLCNFMFHEFSSFE